MCHLHCFDFDRDGDIILVLESVGLRSSRVRRHGDLATAKMSSRVERKECSGEVVRTRGTWPGHVAVHTVPPILAPAADQGCQWAGAGGGRAREPRPRPPPRNTQTD